MQKLLQEIYSLNPNVTVVAVTKNQPADNVRNAIAAGITVVGENRVQELLEKYEQDAYHGASLHFIGHLQRNKVRAIIDKVDMIQSVDSLRLAETINTEARRIGRVMDVLVQVNIGGEETKSGFAPEEVAAVLPLLLAMTNIYVRGFMTIPPPKELPSRQPLKLERFADVRTIAEGNDAEDEETEISANSCRTRGVTPQELPSSSPSKLESRRLLLQLPKATKAKVAVDEVLTTSERTRGVTPQELPSSSPSKLERLADFRTIAEGNDNTISCASNNKSTQDGTNVHYFSQMRKIMLDNADRLTYNHSVNSILSMGMSSDYREAIACGSTMVRLGTILFGQR